ncbi:molybdenum cofactor guanylyltransferase MobA [Neptuniibacter sp. 1_MG-2023]|uniref:molybdenum cofactor guanylyltransferase MobA n=1 Tax=Neptuniibacter sp. 1_MG-2023 TaxID=3062662 RepID=UPI0026E39C31|nr:molybdenum cofactor guanylyltransferase MobA [Neptuniibacter sp. 1_MG-2023]MDO6592578.1 molybdenum cofactor guanylyltransferase MobA [Neptuniibacter sp. 1_MG-2023]
MSHALTQYPPLKIAAVVLAGGQGSRMGDQDKGLVIYDGKPMVCWTLDRLKPLLETVLISCNRNFDQYESFGCTLVKDQINGYQGPLAGIHAAMRQLDAYTHLMVLPCDTPLLDENVIERLLLAAKEHRDKIVVLKTGDQPQFLHAVIPMRFGTELTHWLSSGERAVYKWYKQFPMYFVEMDAKSSALKNINTAQDLP